MLEILSWGEVSGDLQARVTKVRGDGRGMEYAQYLYNTHKGKYT